MKVHDMTEGKPLKLLLAVALPLMLGNVFQQLYTVVDAQVVGGIEGVSALAALGASDWYNWVFLGLLAGFAQGFSIPMAQAFGAKDYASLRRWAGNILWLTVIVTAVLTACALSTIRPVLKWLGTPADIRPLATAYLTILFAGYPVVMAYNASAGILRALGDGKSPLYAMIVSSVTNVALDLLFVAVFRWGVAGAAAATVIAQGCSALYCLVCLRRIPFMRLKREDMRLAAPLCRELMRVSIPVAAQNAIIGIGGMVVQTVINAQGVAFIAGYTATNKLYGILEMAAVSYGYAVSAYAGQNLGAGKPGRIRRGVNTALVTGVVTAAVVGGSMFLAGRPILGTFITGNGEEAAESLQKACEYLYIISGTLPVLYLLHIYRSALTGMGRTVLPMLSGFAEMVMRIASALFLPEIIGYAGVFWAEPLAWAGADLILIPAYYHALRHMWEYRAELLTTGNAGETV